MRPTLWMGFMAIFILGTTLSLITSERWLLSGEQDIVNALASFNEMSIQSGGVWNAPKTIGTYWDATITALTWGYPFLDSPWLFWLKYILWIVSFGVVFGIIQIFVSVISGLVSRLR